MERHAAKSHVHQAEQFEGWLRQAVGVTDLPKYFRKAFADHARLVGPSNVDDLIAWTLLEALETKREQGHIDGGTILRILDKLRRRMVRRAGHKVSGTSLDGNNIQADQSLTPRQTAAAQRGFQEVLGRLSPLHLAIFERRFLEGHSIERLAKEMQMSLPSIYRRLKEIHQEFKIFLADFPFA